MERAGDIRRGKGRLARQLPGYFRIFRHVPGSDCPY